jgi:hypothetical protein
VAEQKQKPRIIDDPAVAEAYSNRLVSITFEGGAVVLTLGVTRMGLDGAQQPAVKVNSRIVLTAPLALELERGLAKLRTALAQAAKRAAAESRSGGSPPPAARQ